MYRILNYSRIKPRSRLPQKKFAYFTHPDFSAAKIGKKSAQITRENMALDPQSSWNGLCLGLSSSTIRRGMPLCLGALHQSLCIWRKRKAQRVLS